MPKRSSPAKRGTRERVRIELVGAQDVLLRELTFPGITQPSVAITYAFCLVNHGRGSEVIDWPKINHAIMARWSKSGLIRVKTLAWRMIRAKQKEAAE